MNNEYHLEYAKEIEELLNKEGYRVYLDDRNEKLGYRMREAVMKKIPVTIILGQKEADDKVISFRLHQNEETKTMKQEEF